jgi:hypothetical protein
MHLLTLDLFSRYCRLLILAMNLLRTLFGGSTLLTKP